MSLMAGFDVVVEITKEALLDLVKRTLPLDGLSLNPPFEVSTVIGDTTLHLIVDDVLLDLADDRLVLRLPFSRGSVLSTTAGGLRLTAIGGEIAIPLRITSGRPPAKVTDEVGVLLVSSEITVSSAALGPAEHDLAEGALRKRLETTPFVGFGIQVVPGVRGELLHGIRVTAVEARGVGNDTLALLFSLSVKSEGNPALKTASAIRPGREIATSISPAAFRSFIFCPSIAGTFGVTSEQLPTECGSGESLAVSGFDITSIGSALEDGHVRVDIAGRKSLPCATVYASVHGQIALALVGNKIVSTPTFDDPDIDLDVDFWCKLASFGLIGVYTFGLLLTGDIIAEAVGKSLFSPPTLKETSLGSMIPGAAFDEIAVTPDGVTLQGHIKDGVSSRPFPILSLNVEVQTIGRERRESGIHRVATGCGRGDYAYEHFLQTQTARATTSVTLFARPVQVEWQILLPGGGVRLSPPEGTATIARVKTTFLDPIGPEITKDVEVRYRISGAAAPGDTLELFNDPSADGTYQLPIQVTAVDETGATLTKSIEVNFEGSVVELGNGYWKTMLGCLLQRSRRYKPLDFDHIPAKGPIPHVYEAPVAEFIRSLASDPAPDGLALLTETPFVFGRLVKRR